jgi:hypothetical protein
MDTNTLNLIERSLTRLLAAQTTQGPTSADDTKSEIESDQITQAVAILKGKCDALLANALPSSRDLNSIEGKRMSENIDPALETFRGSQPYYSLSNYNKMIVLERAKREYENHYDILHRQNRENTWGAYERRTYDTLVIKLRIEHAKLSKLTDTP